LNKTLVVAGIVMGFLIMSMTVVVMPVKSQSYITITIDADGSVTPVSVPIEQRGNTYTLTDSIYGQILVNRNNIVIDGNANVLRGGLLLNKVSNVTVKNFVVAGGYHFSGSPKGLTAGIYLSGTSNVRVTNNTIERVYDFVATFAYYEPVAAIIVIGGHSNNISQNNLVANFRGMELRNTEYNLITENTIESSTAYRKAHGLNNPGNPAGIFFFRASNNTMYHNNFKIEDASSAFDYYYDTVNVWDDGYPSGGNYWSDYSAGEIGVSGIGDRPYVIDAHNSDRYPLLEPFNSTFHALKMTPPKVSLTASVNELNASLVFTADKTLNWTGYSLDGHQNVTITGNTTLTGLPSGPHNITIYANDTYGNMGASETLTFSIIEPFPVAAVSVVLAVIAAVVVAAVCVVVYLKRRRRLDTNTNLYPK